ncbi:MAG: hypothetical protein H7Y03_12615, partial [Chitinophagaceae bacterium]|nr:hypothetical protein [Chitinophagaceae bacterium]
IEVSDDHSYSWFNIHFNEDNWDNDWNDDWRGTYRWRTDTEYTMTNEGLKKIAPEDEKKPFDSMEGREGRRMRKGSIVLKL